MKLDKFKINFKANLFNIILETNVLIQYLYKIIKNNKKKSGKKYAYIFYNCKLKLLLLKVSFWKKKKDPFRLETVTILT